MTLPAGVTEEDFLAVVKRVEDLLCRKFRFGHWSSEEDVRQMIALYSVEAVARFRPEAGNLVGFLFRHCRNRLLNAQRDELGLRMDALCGVCHQAALGRGLGHEDGSTCPAYQSWSERNRVRFALAYPTAIDALPDETNRHACERTAESTAIAKELEALIDEKLPATLREDYFLLRDGEKLPRVRREAVRAAVARIMGCGRLDKLGALTNPPSPTYHPG